MKKTFKELLINASMNIYQTKKRKKSMQKYENILFWRKIDKTIWTPLSNNPRAIFHDHLFFPNFINKNPLPRFLFLGGRKLCEQNTDSEISDFLIFQVNPL